MFPYIKHFHEKWFVHLDIKTRNFLLQFRFEHNSVLRDFGFPKSYIGIEGNLVLEVN
jgi:serine/threonine protein kinase